MAAFTKDYEHNLALMEKKLRISESFDLISRPLKIGEEKASFLFVDGFIKDEAMGKMMQFLASSVKKENMQGVKDAQTFSRQYIPYMEVGFAKDDETVATAVLSGQVALLIDTFEDAILIDARTYPARGVDEPEVDRVLRGSHDGFVETLVFNTALIRRHVRDTRLTMEYFQIGSVSKTDVVMCFMEGVVNQKDLQKLRKKLQSITIPSLTMGQESLSECLFRKQQWYNPFPKTRYTERPDCAASAVAEGRILVIVDNSPAVMILPTAIFDFVQDSNDYYFPPLIGSYLRMVRMIVFFLTMFLTPVWYLLITHPGLIPDWLAFITIKEPNSVPLLVQLLVVELMIDAIKLASLNTPNSLNNAFGVVGALILGEFAVTAGLFVPEVLLYMAFVSIANFTQPSFELAYSVKLFRVLLLILTAAFHIWGFVGGILLMLLIVATTRTALGTSYLYPLIPFDWVAMKRLLVRRILHRSNALIPTNPQKKE